MSLNKGRRVHGPSRPIEFVSILSPCCLATIWSPLACSVCLLLNQGRRVHGPLCPVELVSILSPFCLHAVSTLSQIILTKTVVSCNLTRCSLGDGCAPRNRPAAVAQRGKVAFGSSHSVSSAHVAPIPHVTLRRFRLVCCPQSGSACFMISHQLSSFILSLSQIL